MALKLVLAKHLQVIYFFQLRIYSSLKLNKAMPEVHAESQALERLRQKG